MNVYAIKAYGRYGGGMAIVAAIEEWQAVEVASKISDTIWNTRYDKPESITLLPLTFDGGPMVIEHYETGE